MKSRKWATTVQPTWFQRSRVLPSHQQLNTTIDKQTTTQGYSKISPSAAPPPPPPPTAAQPSPSLGAWLLCSRTCGKERAEADQLGGGGDIQAITWIYFIVSPGYWIGNMVVGRFCSSGHLRYCIKKRLAVVSQLVLIGCRVSEWRSPESLWLAKDHESCRGITNSCSTAHATALLMCKSKTFWGYAGWATLLK